MRYLISILMVFSLLPSAQAAKQYCGWLVNPTPANIWLQDAHGSFDLLIQGSADNNPDIVNQLPSIADDQYVQTNGHYGFGCACLKMDVKDGKVTKVYSSKALTLKQCLEDPSINQQIKNLLR